MLEKLKKHNVKKNKNMKVIHEQPIMFAEIIGVGVMDTCIVLRFGYKKHGNKFVIQSSFALNEKQLIKLKADINKKLEEINN